MVVVVSWGVEHVKRYKGEVVWGARYGHWSFGYDESLSLLGGVCVWWGIQHVRSTMNLNNEQHNRCMLLGSMEAYSGGLLTHSLMLRSWRSQELEGVIGGLCM